MTRLQPGSTHEASLVLADKRAHAKRDRKWHRPTATGCNLNCIGAPLMREDMVRAIEQLPGKLQRECRKRSGTLEVLSGYLRPDEVVASILPGYWSSGALVITTQRLLYMGKGSENIPLSDIRSATADFTQEQMFPAKSVLDIGIRGGGDTSFTFSGTGAALIAEKVLRDVLMR